MKKYNNKKEVFLVLLFLFINFNYQVLNAENGATVTFDSLFKNELLNHDNSFKVFEREVINNQKTVVIKFSTKTCGPCIMTKKPFENLAKEYSNKALFIELAADQFSALSSNLKVFKVPTFMVFSKGKLELRAEGTGPALIQLKNYLSKI